MGIEGLAEAMGVSPRNAAAFVVGVKLQMDRGLDLMAAVVAHRDSLTRSFDDVASRSNHPIYRKRTRSSAFFPAEFA